MVYSQDKSGKNFPALLQKLWSPLQLFPGLRDSPKNSYEGSLHADVVLARHTMLRHRENNCDNSKKMQ